MSFVVRDAARSADARARTIPFESGVSDGPAAAAALHGQLLPDGDALHRLRHRDRLPLPARGRSSTSSRWFGVRRVRRSSSRSSRSPTSTSGGRERSNGSRAEEAPRRLRAAAPSACSGRARARASSSRSSATSSRRLDADDAREGGRLGADEVDVAGHVRARLLRDRDDVDRLVALRHRALRHGGVPLLAAPGRPADRLRPRRRTRWPRRCARSTTRCSSRSG